VGRSEELQGMIHEKVADYLWLTPVSAKGPPRRCWKGSMSVRR